MDNLEKLNAVEAVENAEAAETVEAVENNEAAKATESAEISCPILNCKGINKRYKSGVVVFYNFNFLFLVLD